ncbi:hypothetical protein PINS_up022650 [Pythium insidiosum]|nr:hypothetical protein PINS_up022650 [Pythium insidiosum]
MELLAQVPELLNKGSGSRTTLQKNGNVGIAMLLSRHYTRRSVLVPDLFADAEVDEVRTRRALGAAPGAAAGDKVPSSWRTARVVIVWLGLLKVGVVTALINTHCSPTDCALHQDRGAKAVILGNEMLDKVAAIEQQLFGLSFHCYGDGVTPWAMTSQYPFASSLDVELSEVSATAPPVEIRRGAQIQDGRYLATASSTRAARRRLPKAGQG